jgi:transcriptional regulator with XRE-family HTH domain
LKGLTQYQLSNLTSIPQSRISLLENGLVVPKFSEAERLAKVLEVNLAEIFPQFEKAIKDNSD